MTRAPFIAMLLAVPSVAFAHSEAAAGFISGFLHPLLGIDHLLAMVSVGVVSAQLGGRYIWSVPAIFVTCMVVGGSVGAAGVELPFVETGIAWSVLVLGLSIVFARETRSRGRVVIMLGVAFFGTLHGHAHGVEMPGALSPVFYSAGFVVSTSSIHVAGVYLGKEVREPQRTPRYLGGAIAVAGALVLVGLL